VLGLRPWPVLFDEAGSHVLFAPGKHGFSPAVPDGATVRLRGSAMSHGDARGVEVNSLDFVTASAHTPAPVRLRSVSVIGEIVDSKCYFGVMNPGRGKVHRDCAVRCIAGGIPPALLVRDRDGMLRPLILSGIPASELKDWIGERVRVSGELLRYGSLLTISASGISSLQRE
jgi:hypothetical protein